MLEVLLFNFSGGFFHFFFDTLDLFVAFVDCDSFDLLGKGQLFDAFLNLFESNTALPLC